MELDSSAGVGALLDAEELEGKEESSPEPLAPAAATAAARFSKLLRRLTGEEAEDPGPLPLSSSSSVTACVHTREKVDNQTFFLHVLRNRVLRAIQQLEMKNVNHLCCTHSSTFQLLKPPLTGINAPHRGAQAFHLSCRSQ